MDWIENILKLHKRRLAVITYDPHYFIRESDRNLEISLVEETVRTGDVVARKCTYPNRICFKRYFGKSNETYEAPVEIHKHFWEVKSAWKRKGRT